MGRLKIDLDKASIYPFLSSKNGETKATLKFLIIESPSVDEDDQVKTEIEIHGELNILKLFLDTASAMVADTSEREYRWKHFLLMQEAFEGMSAEQKAEAIRVASLLDLHESY